jgi:PAS domain S-box-containing protein
MGSSSSAAAARATERSKRRLDRLTEGLAECEERFHTSLETLIDPFVLLAPLRDEAGGIVDFVYEYANEAACETNVLGREELVGMSMLERVTQLAPVSLFDEYVNVIETCVPLALDDFAQPNRRGGDPDQRSFDVRALKAGELLVLTWRDVTERDRAEEDHARLATIVRSSYDAIISVDVDQRIASWNSGAESLYGYDAEEVLGSSGEVLIPPDATRESRGLCERMLAGEDVRRYETRGDAAMYVAKRSGSGHALGRNADP